MQVSNQGKATLSDLVLFCFQVDFLVELQKLSIKGRQAR
jgi:hypothetical protein